MKINLLAKGKIKEKESFNFVLESSKETKRNLKHLKYQKEEYLIGYYYEYRS